MEELMDMTMEAVLDYLMAVLKDTSTVSQLVDLKEEMRVYCWASY